MPCVVKETNGSGEITISCTLPCFHMVVKVHNLPLDYTLSCTSVCFHMAVKEKVKIENGIWIGIDFICWIDCSMCVLLLTGQRFKAICN